MVESIITAPPAAEAAPPADLPDAEGDMPAVVDALANLPEGAVVTEAGLARIFNRCVASVKAAVDRGELPRPVKVFGKPCWTAGAIVRHTEARLDAEARKFAKLRV
ncbi:MAG: hypothetical protein NTW87_21000 [Planctomycetota bacterium]|nr:hypothetical protein [Planctomycetota bacterium]